MNSIFSDFPDVINEALLPMVISVFAIALPLLLQTISRIDDKYGSTKLVDTFRKEPICNWYIITLIATIISCIFWMLQLPRFFDLGILNWLIENSAFICVTIATIVLVALTIVVVNLTYTYYHPLKLFRRLQRKHNQSKNNKKRFFVGISNILFYSIQKDDEDLSRELLEFYFGAFIKFRKNKEGQIIEYPQEYYDSIFAANELLCQRKRRTVSHFNDATFFEFFLDEYQHTVISPKTYNFIWRCLLQALHYDRDDFVMSYWRKAHQLFNFFLKPADKKHDDKFQIINQEEIENREREREAFLEFHYALGGLLMYLKKYQLLKEVIYWTNQQPPKYVLVPERMEEVITRYMDVSKKGGYINPVYYEQRYPYPNISGVNADGIIQMWIKRYLSILFLRQYTLHSYYTYSNPLNMPAPPNSLSDMKCWNDELDSLERYTNNYLSDKDVLIELGLSDITENNWFANNSKEHPTDLISKLKKEIDKQFDQKKQNQEISPDIYAEFKAQTIKTLTNTFKSYSEVFRGNIESNYKSLFIGGRYDVMEKAAFAANQEMSYANSDSIVAEGVSLEFGYTALNAFALMHPKKYILKEEDIFKSIDQLNLDSERFVIVAIGVNVNYFSMLKIQGLKQENETWQYNGIEIIDIYNQMNDFVRQSFFIIKKADLPAMVYNEVSEKIISKFSLQKIDDVYNIYANIIDLNKAENQPIKNEISNSNVDDLTKAVLVCVGINTEIKYKQDAKCMQLKIFYQFEDRGTVNTLSDIQSIWT